MDHKVAWFSQKKKDFIDEVRVCMSKVVEFIPIEKLNSISSEYCNEIVPFPPSPLLPHPLPGNIQLL
jgi:hypothetical protein